MIARVPPDRRQHEIRHHISERRVAQDVVDRAAAPVSKAAAAQEREGRIDLASHEQKDERRAEGAAGHRPLAEPHLPPAPRQKTEPKREQRGGDNADQRAVHERSSRFAGSNRKMIAMIKALSTIHATHHASRNGMPRTVGSTRLTKTGRSAWRRTAKAQANGSCASDNPVRHLLAYFPVPYYFAAPFLSLSSRSALPCANFSRSAGGILSVLRKSRPVRLVL